MQTKTKTYLSILTLAVFFIMGIASSPAHKVFSDADNWIPSDFKPDHGTLLIETHPVNSKQNDRMLDFLQKNYPYPYEVVNKDAIESKTGKYADTKKYPFAVMWNDKGSINTTLNTSTGTYSNMPQYDLFGNFVDRNTGKTYPATKKINNYGQVGYVPFFNSITKKFK